MKAQTTAALFVGMDALRAHPLRSVLSTLGVVIGVAALVAILALGDGLEAFSREQIESTTDLQNITIDSETTERTEGISIRRENVRVLTIEDEEALARELEAEAVIALSVTTSARVRALAPDSARRAVIVRATTPRLLAQLEGFSIVAGRFLDDEDVRSARRVVVVPERLASDFVGAASSGAVIGRAIRIGEEDFEVVGVLGEPPESGRERERAQAFRRPLGVVVPLGTSAVEASTGSGGARTPTLTVKAMRIEDVPRVREHVNAWLKRRYANGAEDFTVRSSEARVDQTRRAMLVMRLALGSITGISILVGGIGIMNIMLASVHERTREIGIRKAAGARGRDILLQFLAESVTISGLGSLIGVMLGLAGAAGVTLVIRMLTEAPVRPAFTWTTLLVAAIVAIGVGLAFGTYPARRAAALSPIDAIRHE
ncbi:MAG: ABC transporter permease [Longimicrobiales bacterium]